MAGTEKLSLTGKSVAPGLTADDLQKSMEFYQGLGFGIDERWENEGELRGVMLRAGDIQIGLSQDDWQKGRDRTKGLGMRIYISTLQDVDQLAAAARAAGITLDSEPHDTPWGSRAFEVTDPDGFKLTIATE
jgi:uncharacterized glyoxalase superfamily protein PhnB